MIAITARQPRGYWSAKTFHTATRTFHFDGAFTPAQMAELEADAPWLIVERDVDGPEDLMEREDAERQARREAARAAELALQGEPGKPGAGKTEDDSPKPGANPTDPNATPSGTATGDADKPAAGGLFNWMSGMGGDKQ